MNLSVDRLAALNPPSSEDFLKTLGQVSWLLTVSREVREQPISYIETNFIAPLTLKQVRVFVRDNQPIAALSWAYASAEVVSSLKDPRFRMGLIDWRSGPEVSVVACVAPFGSQEPFKKAFLDEVSAARTANKDSEELK